jgi:glyoxylase-like metal-dependent hydrolase (beta-lactamase superfamily II)
VLQGEIPAPPPPFLGRFGFLARLMPSPDWVLVDHRIAGMGVTTVEDVMAIETPGHTDGHISYLLNRDGGLLFVGDAAVANRSGNVRRGFMNRAEPVFDGSIKKLAELEFDKAVFGHSAPIVKGASRAFAQFAETLA